MSDRVPRPTTAAGGAVKKVNLTHKNRMSSLPTTGKPVVKVGTVGSNLLPSKISVAGPSSMAKGSTASRPGVGAVARPAATSAERLSNAYEIYLQSLLTDLILKQSEALKHTIFCDKLVLKSVVSARDAYKLNIQYANKMALCVFKHIMELGKLAAPLENLVDFTGDEALVQIQSILSSKFDRIVIEGGVLNKPMFEDVEIEAITEKMKSCIKNDCDEKTTLQFGTHIKELLQKLDVKLQIAEGNNNKTKRRNKVLLQSCTVAIMSSHALGLESQSPTESIEVEDD